MGLLVLDGAAVQGTQSAPSAFQILVAAMDRVALTSMGDVEVIYQPAIGAPVIVTGISDSAYDLVQGTAHAGTEALVNTVFLILADLPTDPEQDDPTLTIGGINYRVVERRPAAFGAIVLALRAVT